MQLLRNFNAALGFRYSGILAYIGNYVYTRQLQFHFIKPPYRRRGGVAVKRAVLIFK